MILKIYPEIIIDIEGNNCGCWCGRLNASEIAECTLFDNIVLKENNDGELPFRCQDCIDLESDKLLPNVNK